MDLNDSADHHIELLQAWLAAHPQPSQARQDRELALRRWQAHAERVDATREVWLAQKRCLLARAGIPGEWTRPEVRH